MECNLLPQTFLRSTAGEFIERLALFDLVWAFTGSDLRKLSRSDSTQRICLTDNPSSTSSFFPLISISFVALKLISSSALEGQSSHLREVFEYGQVMHGRHPKSFLYLF